MPHFRYQAVNSQQQPIAGWSWRLDDDESSIVISRNAAKDLAGSPVNTLQRCTLSMACTALQPELPLTDSLQMQPRYIVPR